MNDVKMCKKCRERFSEEDKPQGIYLYCWDYCDDKPMCDECQSKLVDVPISTEDYETIVEVSNTIGLLEAMIKLKKENIIEYQSRMSQFRSQSTQSKTTQSTSPTQRKCRFCGGTGFTPVKRKWSLMAGIFTNKNDLVCNNCGKKVQWIDM